MKWCHQWKALLAIGSYYQHSTIKQVYLQHFEEGGVLSAPEEYSAGPSSSSLKREHRESPGDCRTRLLIRQSRGAYLTCSACSADCSAFSRLLEKLEHCRPHRVHPSRLRDVESSMETSNLHQIQTSRKSPEISNESR